jgi:hypothetical protein
MHREMLNHMYKPEMPVESFGTKEFMNNYAKQLDKRRRSMYE